MLLSSLPCSLAVLLAQPGDRQLFVDFCARFVGPHVFFFCRVFRESLGCGRAACLRNQDGHMTFRMLARAVALAAIAGTATDAFCPLPPQVAPAGTVAPHVARTSTSMCAGRVSERDAPCAPAAVALHRRRRAAGAALLLAPLLLGRPSSAAGSKSAKQKWAKRSGEFTDEELEGFEESESGLQFKEVQPGSGATAARGEKVAAHFSAFALDSGRLVDSSYERGEPITLTVGEGRDGVPAALDEALMSMNVGARRVLIVPATQAFSVASPVNFILSQLDDSCQHAHFKPDVCPTGKLGFLTKGVGPIPRGAQLVFYVERVALDA